MRQILRRAGILASGILCLSFIVSPAVAGKKHQLREHFLNTGLQPTATGNVSFVATTPLNAFKISVSRMSPGTYDVTLDGAVVDTLTVGAKGKGSVQHKAVAASKRTPAQPLPYDPRGAQLAIAATGDVLLEADVPETPEEGQQRVEIEATLDNLGAVGGEAKAEFEELSGRMQFEVELENVPTGSYDLLVDGAKVGSITTGIDGDGKIEFDSIPSAGDDDESGDEANLDLLLTFDPRGRSIRIQQGGVDLFSTVFPTVGTGDDGEGEEEGGEGD